MRLIRCGGSGMGLTSLTLRMDGSLSAGHYPGIGYADMQRSGIYAPIYDLHLRFYAPLVLDDVAVVHTRYVYRPGARLDFEYKVYREADGILCAEGSTVQLFIDTEGMLMVDSPDYYKEWQARYREQNDNHP